MGVKGERRRGGGKRRLGWERYGREEGEYLSLPWWLFVDVRGVWENGWFDGLDWFGVLVRLSLVLRCTPCWRRTENE